MSSGPGNFCLVHVSLVPVLNVVGEQTGAQIIYAKYSGTEVEFNDILKEDDIVGILETEDIRDLKPLND
ncbi:BnaA07g04980D [Brassica napus]|uniref:BnaA07g04980D protein n=1 Tax=Brassica napus TaxID=3708 RepID=A0A078EFD7_BRANA|nr:BnaA07g04980D [Brassica napus]